MDAGELDAAHYVHRDRPRGMRELTAMEAIRWKQMEF